jgi:four helix bundle protein
MFNFEKLQVWQEAIELCDRIYVVTRRFPDDERFGLTSQIRRSAVSVSANLAEGAGRSSDRDKTRFLDMATGSLLETVSHLTIASRQGFLKPADHQGLYAHCEKIGRMLAGLRKHLQKSRSDKAKKKTKKGRANE